MRRLRRFLSEVEGQDVIEYSLLICFITMTFLWIAAWGRDPIKGIWTNVNHKIDVAKSVANGSD